MSSIPPLRKARFRAWLESRSSRQKVGLAGFSRSCPIACFVAEQSGGTLFNVGVEATRIRIGHGTASVQRRLPQWARCFVQKVDAVGPSGTTIHADTALAILGDC